MKKSFDLNDIDTIAKWILENSQFKCFTFEGQMGVGKTTLIKSVCKLLGTKDLVSSPTFSLVNEYLTEENTIYHFDCYRLNNIEEALDFGSEEYLYSNAYCLIEWAEKIEALLPQHKHRISLTAEENGNRVIEFN